MSSMARRCFYLRDVVRATGPGRFSLQNRKERLPRHWADSRRARMKVVRLLEYGGELVFNDVPTPTIARDEILVKIKSTAVNHLDLVEASGTGRQILPIGLPWIPGHEFSGVVEQTGSDVAACAPGDAVFGTTTGMGAYAEYLAVKAAAIARKPPNLSFREGHSCPGPPQLAGRGSSP